MHIACPDMNASRDPRDDLRINISLENAVKTGKLLGSMYDAVALCRDGHRSSHMIEQALMSGIISTGGDVYLAGECPAPAMPYARTGCDCYVSIAADEPDQMSGINIHNPDGSYFDGAQVQALMSKESRIAYPDYSGLGQVHNIYGIFGRYSEAINRFVKRCNCQFVMDGTYSAPTNFASRILLSNDSETVIFKRPRSHHVKSLDEYNYYDIIHTMDSYPGSIAAALNNDGSKAVMFDEERNRINSTHLGAILVKITGARRITAPMDVSLAVVDAVPEGGIVTHTDRNIKRVVDFMASRNRLFLEDQMLVNKFDMGMDAYGRFVFSDVSYTPDGIATMMKIGEYASEGKISDLVKSIPDYPRIKERVLTTVICDEFMEVLLNEVRSAEYDSLVEMSGFRLEFDNGWILIEVNSADQYVEITCESRDRAYVVGLMDIGKSIVNSAIREFD